MVTMWSEGMCTQRKKWPVTPCGIWPQWDLRVRFSYLEGRRKAIKEAEGLHLGLLSSRDG